MAQCIYCNAISNISTEHLVSASVLRELYGPKIKNMHHGKKGGEWKLLPNFEGVIKDVCRECNTKLSNLGYDTAGAILTKEIMNNPDEQPVELTFNQFTLGWLLKTHLNLVRDAIPTLPKQISINQHIFTSLIKGEIVDSNNYMMICQAIDMPNETWKKVSSMNAQVGVVNEHDLVISQLRIRQLDTFFVFSSNDKLRDISEKEDTALVSVFMTTLNNDLQKIDIEKSLVEKHITIEKTISPELFSTGIMTTKEYENLFKG
jgi:hypothetical protein